MEATISNMPTHLLLAFSQAAKMYRYSADMPTATEASNWANSVISIPDEASVYDVALLVDLELMRRELVES